MYTCVQRLSLQVNKAKLSEISQKLITVISALHLPCRRRFSHCHFGKFTVNLLNLKNEHSEHKNTCDELELV